MLANRSATEDFQVARAAADGSFWYLGRLSTLCSPLMVTWYVRGRTLYRNYCHLNERVQMFFPLLPKARASGNSKNDLVVGLSQRQPSPVSHLGRT